ncbi:SpoIIE family protein phosphatase [Streptomyces sp. B6B3]|uniref:PP2C family protein-serine/threonine phosphatase n=1 Tax=Streptomyces sp. B6B3 TaxID=3153570 RepID=UPI00325F7C36
MLSSQHPDHPVPHPADPSTGAESADDALAELVAQTRRLRDGVEAARRAEPVHGPRQRVRRAVWDLATHQLDDFRDRLDQLRLAAAPDGRARLGAHIGSAEWNLLTDGVVWSDEVYAIFGRPVEDGPLTLDQLPSCLPPQDQPALTAAVTGCLVDGRGMDCEFRVLRPDGGTRTVQLSGEPVLDEQGGTVAMWAMIRDVSELRRSQVRALAAVPEENEELRRQHRIARAERGLAIELADTALAPWLRAPEPRDASGPPGSLELAARYLPARAGTPMSGKWYDALRLPDGARLLSVGDLSGQGSSAAASTATALGAIRGMALTGTQPGPLLGHLNQLLDRGVHPVLASTVCCRYQPAGGSGAGASGGVLTWAQAGHPAPVLCRAGTGRSLPRPVGPLLGAVTDARYPQRADRLEPGDVLVLTTDGLFSDIPPDRPADRSGDPRLLALGPRLAAAGSAEECLALIVEACGETGRDDDACVLVARVRP